MCVEQLLADAMKVPPLAIIVDLRSQVAIGSKSLKPIFELKTTWPVLRCNVHPDGSATVMCLEPHRTETLLSALHSIANGDESWVPEGKFQNFLRLSIQFRVRMRREKEEWIRGNTLDISARGAFITSYDDFKKEERIELEINDVADRILKLQGIVKWIRRWEDTPELPGIGVSFEPTDDIQVLAEEIAKRFIQHPKKTKKNMGSELK